MRLFIFGSWYWQDNSTEAFEIFTLNGRDKRNFKHASRNAYSVLLLDDADTILAECAVDPTLRFPCIPKIDHYYISDVHVPKAHRGNGYAVLLLLNLFNEFWSRGLNHPFRLDVDRHNVSAYRSYLKVFGKPCSANRFIASFCATK